MMLLEFLRETAFREKFDVDVERDLLVSFQVPGIGELGVTSFDPSFWNQLTLLIVLQTLVNLACAFLNYRVILPRPNTATAFVVGYGLVCPILIALPFYSIEVLDLRNATLMIATAAGPSMLCFRTLEAMYETIPAYATGSLGSYVLYFCSTVQFDFDPKTENVKHVSWSSLFRRVRVFAWLFLLSAVMYSILIPLNFQVFPMERNSWVDLFHWKSLANNYIMAFHTSLSLEVGSAGIALGISTLTGIETMDLNDKPLTKSTSPSDFWGNRWNRVVSSALKRGVFIPMRKQGFSRPLAAMATFVASGLLHEYTIVVMTYNDPSVYTTVAFRQLAFFMWNGVVLGIEHFLRGNKLLAQASKIIPHGPLRSFLVVLTVLPLAHLFTQISVDIGFYNSFGRGFPKIVKL